MEITKTISSADQQNVSETNGVNVSEMSVAHESEIKTECPSVRANEIYVMRIVHETTVDGPGWRHSIYCSGCYHACPNCHNPETWPLAAGQLRSVDSIIAELQDTEGNVTFTGGDPLYQAEAFAELARRIATELHRTIWCYTGFTFEEVLADEKMSKLLPYLEVLVDGPFLMEQRNLNLLFRGSNNQRLVDVQKSLQAGKVIEFEYNPFPTF